MYDNHILFNKKKKINILHVKKNSLLVNIVKRLNT